MWVVLTQVMMESFAALLPVKVPVLALPFLFGTWLCIAGLNANHPASTVVVSHLDASEYSKVKVKDDDE
jgi:urea transporter